MSAANPTTSRPSATGGDEGAPLLSVERLIAGYGES